MGTVRVSHLGWRLPGGIELLRDVSFIVRDGERAALVGANGVGKSTVLALVAGDAAPTSGTISVDGRLGVMRQLVGVAGAAAGPQTVVDLLVSLAPAALQRVNTDLRAAETTTDTDPMGYAHAVAAWSDAGGYATEVYWDECTTRAVGLPLDEVARRPLRTFSGGEQKRLALEVLLRGDADVLLLDEPDNFLDVDAKRWLEHQLQATHKTVLYVSHDRQLLAATATKIVTIEANGAWTLGGGFAGYAEARRGHLDTLDKDRALYDDERKRLEAIVAEMRRRARTSDVFAPKLKAAESRLRHFVERQERPSEVREQRIAMRLGAGRALASGRSSSSSSSSTG